jgi:hypothetical protein
MHGRAHEHLDGFQIQVARFAHAGEDGPQQLLYFARDFLLDSVRRFFSCSLRRCSSTGRRRQMFSFTSRNERLSSWNFRNSAISRSALRTDAGVGKASLMVLP